LKSSDLLLSIAWSSSEFLGVPRSSLEFLGVPESSSEFLGVPRSSSEFLGVPQSSSESFRLFIQIHGTAWLLQDSSLLSRVQLVLQFKSILFKFEGCIGELDSKWIEAVKSYITFIAKLKSNCNHLGIWLTKNSFWKAPYFSCQTKMVFIQVHMKNPFSKCLIFKGLIFKLEQCTGWNYLWAMITNICCYYIHITIV